MEILCEAKIEYAEECKRVVETAMKSAANLWCQTVEMNADGVIGDYWSH